MVEKVPSFKTGGAFWFTDLTTPDSLYIFPVLTSLTFLLTVEVGILTFSFLIFDLASEIYNFTVQKMESWGLCSEECYTFVFRSSCTHYALVWGINSCVAVVQESLSLLVDITKNIDPSQPTKKNETWSTYPRLLIQLCEHILHRNFSTVNIIYIWNLTKGLRH